MKIRPTGIGTWLIVLLAVALIAISGYFYYKSNQKAQEPFRTVTAEIGEVVVKVSATGTISAVNSVDISSKVTGLIKEVTVKENDEVKAGQTLVVLDDSAIKAQLRQMKAKLDNARINYERAKDLHKIGAYSHQQLDAAWLEFEVAKTNYDNIASTLEDYVIRAPINGKVIGKPIPAGQTVSQGISTPMVIMTLADLAKMQIEALIDESDIGKIQLNQKVEFSVDAYPDKMFTGVVTQISNKATTQNNVIYYTVYINIDAPEGLLKPSMTARLTVYVDRRADVIVAPLTVLEETKGKKFVKVLDAGKVKLAEVTTGLRGEDSVEITSGIKAGDKLLLPAPRPQNVQMRPPGPPPPFR